MAFLCIHKTIMCLYEIKGFFNKSIVQFNIFSMLNNLFNPCVRGDIFALISCNFSHCRFSIFDVRNFTF